MSKCSVRSCPQLLGADATGYRGSSAVLNCNDISGGLAVKCPAVLLSAGGNGGGGSANGGSVGNTGDVCVVACTSVIGTVDGLKTRSRFSAPSDSTIGAASTSLISPVDISHRMCLSSWLSIMYFECSVCMVCSTTCGATGTTSTTGTGDGSAPVEGVRPTPAPGGGERRVAFFSCCLGSTVSP